MTELWTEAGYYNPKAVEDGSIWEGEMKWSDWEEKYKPIKNHLDKYGNGESLMFETYGAEQEYVQSRGEKYVWTFVDGDCSSLIIAGYHFVNRLGYYVTEEPWETGNEQVLLSVEVECECYNEDGYEHTYANPELGTYTEFGDPDCKLCEGQGYRTEYLD
jgi:hypothetical protein